MGSTNSGTARRTTGPGTLVRRRLLGLIGLGAIATALAACGGGGGSQGTREDPFPYQNPRGRTTRL